MELKKKRELLDILRGLIGQGYEGTQEDIKSELGKHGYELNQSTISRSLKKLGVSKVQLKNGQSRYELHQKTSIVDYGGRIGNLISSIESNESLIVIRTTPGAAMFIAGQIDYHLKHEVLGTIAGDDTIFISPKSVKKIKICERKVLEFLS